MISKLKVIRLSDNKIFEVNKYIFSENEHHIWCNDWYGRHVIGNDCKWFDEDKWINVKSQLPPKGIDKKYPNASLEVLTTDGEIVQVSFYEDGWSCAKEETKYDWYKPTHWMYFSDLLPVSQNGI